MGKIPMSIRKDFHRVFTAAIWLLSATIATPLLPAGQRDANPRRLKQLAEASGGEAFRPRDIGDIGDAMERIARDIRSAYTIGYVPVNETRDGRFRGIRVIVRPPDRRSVSVRTRQGYVMEPR